MDILKSQWDRIQQQLSGLTPSQKMLSAALVAIMVMTLWWWGQFAGTPEYEPLLDQALSQEDVGRIDHLLTGAGIPHKVDGSKIVVPADRKTQALANIAYANALPRNTASGFDEMIKQLTAWDGQDRQNAIFNHGKELSLQRVISQFPGVATATVLIDASTKFRIGQKIEATATVDVKTKEGGAGNARQLASACAHLVSGAQAGLKPSRVRVVIDSRPYPVPDSDGDGVNGMLATNVLEAQQAAELAFTSKIEKHLDYIPAVRVSVTVRVNNASETADQTTVDKDKSGTFEKRSTSKTREESTTTPGNGEGGTVPNTVMEIGPAVANGPTHSSTDTEDTVENEIVPGVTRKQTVTPAGNHSAVAASVRVPRSYFVMVAKHGDPAAKEPDTAALELAIERELPKIKAAVTACTAIDKPDAITVDSYTDFIVPPREPQMAAASGVTMMLGGHVKEIALGGLALASLFMMSMMVRKGAVAPVAVAAPVIRSSLPATLVGGEDIAGEAAEQSPALDGMELDEDSIKTQQMLSQVTSMVGDNPDTAAQLIKRWMNQR